MILPFNNEKEIDASYLKLGNSLYPLGKRTCFKRSAVPSNFLQAMLSMVAQKYETGHHDLFRTLDLHIGSRLSIVPKKERVMQVQTCVSESRILCKRMLVLHLTLTVCVL